mmetsp:Transcript_85862/g.277228  ORF Transcript_85862/g.277228 Transcript_85862/m.277228 type:complete len:328 (-) Transcript_85862:54-1037(-)
MVHGRGPRAVPGLGAAGLPIAAAAELGGRALRAAAAGRRAPAPALRRGAQRREAGECVAGPPAHEPRGRAPRRPRGFRLRGPRGRGDAGHGRWRPAVPRTRGLRGAAAGLRLGRLGAGRDAARGSYWRFAHSRSGKECLWLPCFQEARRGPALRPPRACSVRRLTRVIGPRRGRRREGLVGGPPRGRPFSAAFCRRSAATPMVVALWSSVSSFGTGGPDADRVAGADGPRQHFLRQQHRDESEGLHFRDATGRVWVPLQARGLLSAARRSACCRRSALPCRGPGPAAGACRRRLRRPPSGCRRPWWKGQCSEQGALLPAVFWARGEL